LSSTNRPRHFGLKHDVPARLYGKQPEAIMIKDLDGDFGQATIYHADQSVRAYNTLRDLEEAFKAGKPVPVRLLNRLHRTDAYSVGACGLVGRLPYSEIPEGIKITFTDMWQRRAFWMYVKSMEITKERQYVQFTMYKPHNHK
jgi:hypothetical protein